MPLPSNTPVGAFTNLTIAAINQALLQAGLAATTGNVFYCDPVNGLDTNNGQVPASGGVAGVGPVQSLAAGYALLRSGYNDVLVLIGNGQSSGSARIHATFTWSKNAAHLIGICAPSAISQRARIANGTADAGFANFFVVSGNGCLFSNLSWFQGFAVGVAAEILVTITGSRNAFVNCDFEGMGDTQGATDNGSRVILFKAGGSENLFKHCNFGLDTVARTGTNSTIEWIGNSCQRNIFEDCTFLIDSGDGDGFIFYTAAAAAADRFQLFKRCVFINAVQSGATAVATLASLAANMGGMIVMYDAITVGFTKLGTAAAVAQMYVYGQAAANTAYLSDSPAS